MLAFLHSERLSLTRKPQEAVNSDQHIGRNSENVPMSCPWLGMPWKADSKTHINISIAISRALKLFKADKIFSHNVSIYWCFGSRLSTKYSGNGLPSSTESLREFSGTFFGRKRIEFGTSCVQAVNMIVFLMGENWSCCCLASAH